jgi:hypothetical protein
MDTEKQLEEWSRQGQVSTAQELYVAVKSVLKAGYILRDIDFEVYMHGSYQNDTNINDQPDVDIVVQLNQWFFRDLSELNPDQVAFYKQTYPENADYTYDQFWLEIIRTLHRLVDASTITYGYKSDKVYSASKGISANLLIGLQHRKYQRFHGLNSQNFTEGIQFYSLRDKSWVVNYPKLHYIYGCVKNLPGQTNGWFKPTIRIFKNARNKLVETGKITKNLAPSYFIECLLYNVPNELYGVSRQATFDGVLGWLDKAPFEGFKCQSGQGFLFGNLLEQWNLQNAKKFVNELAKLR